MLSSASLTAKLRGKWNTQTIKKNLLENSINEFSKNSKKIFPAMSSKLHRMPIFEWTYQYSSGLGILRGIAFSSSNRRWSNILSRVLYRDKKNESYTKVKGAIDPSAPTIYPELIPVFIAWSDGWDSSLSRATATRLFARTHLLSWLEREALWG